MVALLEALPPQHGTFVANCAAHCQTGTAEAWNNRQINGVSMSKAFTTWYEDSARASHKHKHIEKCDGGAACPSDHC
jgi:hypothetical protein